VEDRKFDIPKTVFHIVAEYPQVQHVAAKVKPPACMNMEVNKVGRPPMGLARKRLGTKDYFIINASPPFISTRKNKTFSAIKANVTNGTVLREVLSSPIGNIRFNSFYFGFSIIHISRLRQIHSYPIALIHYIGCDCITKHDRRYPHVSYCSGSIEYPISLRPKNTPSNGTFPRLTAKLENISPKMIKRNTPRIFMAITRIGFPVIVQFRTS